MSADIQASHVLPFPPDYRACGVLLHVTSLPSPYGIGDLGPAAFAWIDWLRKAGQTWWQALPAGPTGYANSPYQSLCSFAGNWLLISPARLIEDGLLSEGDCEGLSFPPALWTTMLSSRSKIVCPKSLVQFRAGVRRDLGAEYENFCHYNARWLNDYALFRALKVRYKGAYYLDWPIEMVQRLPQPWLKSDENSRQKLTRFALHNSYCSGKRSNSSNMRMPGASG